MLPLEAGRASDARQSEKRSEPEAGLSSSLLDRAEKRRKNAKKLRLTLRHAMTGDKICLPGVSTPENEWTVPGNYLVNELLHHGGVAVFKVGADGTVNANSELFRVSAVLTSAEARLAPRSYKLFECASDANEVSLVFGSGVIEFAGLPFSEPACVDVTNVQTPSTPSDSD